MILLIYLSLTVLSVLCGEVQYEGYKVYRVRATTLKQIEILHSYSQNTNFDFWSELRNVEYDTDVMVMPGAQLDFELDLKRYNINYKVLIENVQSVLKEQIQRDIPATNRISFKEYLRYDTIINYLNDLAKNYPKLVTLETIGKSYEGRELTAIKISSGGNNTKPVILIDGGIHAREWISPATVLYIIDQLVVNKTNSNMYEHVDWYLIPVINPDGYEYTHTQQRLWRKTRSPGNVCYGADANRNFDYHWGNIGSSNNECDNLYRGKAAFSEIEMLSLANFAKKYAKNIKLYINVHSYGQLLLYPWSDVDKPCDNEIELQTIGNVANSAISSVNGTEYTVGYWYKVLYPSSGTSIDYMYSVLNIPMTYTLELPDRGYGFVLPPEYIHGVVTETFAGIEIFGKYIEIAHGGM